MDPAHVRRAALLERVPRAGFTPPACHSPNGRRETGLSTAEIATSSPMGERAGERAGVMRYVWRAPPRRLARLGLSLSSKSFTG